MKKRNKLKTAPVNVTSRKHFQLKTLRSRLEGRCISCPEPAVPNELRCATHKEANRQRVLAWHHAKSAKQKRRTARKSNQNRRRYLAEGRCPGCREHPPTNGRLCHECRALERARHRGDREKVAKIRSYRVKLRTLDLMLRVGAQSSKKTT